MNIAVFCSSSNHIDEAYQEAAFRFGKWIAENDNVLVYGGATGGLMSSVSQGAFSCGGEIKGVISRSVIDRNRKSEICTELIEVDTLAERKSRIKAMADVFVVLPGSYGTLDEMMDVIASGIVGEHKKKLIVVNEGGVFDKIMEWEVQMKKEMFIPSVSYQPIFVSNIDQCCEFIKKNF